jgi:hypothetical protein
VRGRVIWRVSRMEMGGPVWRPRCTGSWPLYQASTAVTRLSPADPVFRRVGTEGSLAGAESASGGRAQGRYDRVADTRRHAGRDYPADGGALSGSNRGHFCFATTSMARQCEKFATAGGPQGTQNALYDTIGGYSRCSGVDGRPISRGCSAAGYARRPRGTWHSGWARRSW